MNGPARAAPSESDAAEALEREVDETIALCDCDVREALRAALVANSFLTAEVERLTQAVSFGFTRGKDFGCTTRQRKNGRLAGDIFRQSARIRIAQNGRRSSDRMRSLLARADE